MSPGPQSGEAAPPPRRHASVKSREIAGETLLVPFRGRLAELRQLFVLNEVGAFLWERLDGVHDRAALERAVVEHFEVSPEEAAADLDDFLASLAEAGLLGEG